MCWVRVALWYCRLSRQANKALYMPCIENSKGNKSPTYLHVIMCIHTVDLCIGNQHKNWIEKFPALVFWRAGYSRGGGQRISRARYWAKN